MLISVLYVGVSHRLTLMKCEEFRRSTAVSVVPTVENRNTHGAFPDSSVFPSSRGQSILTDIMTKLESFISRLDYLSCVSGLNAAAVKG